MGQSSAQISLEEFMIEMGRDPVSSLTHERLMDLTYRLTISDELIESRTCFAANTYARNLVCRTPSFELLVLCWRPGHESTIHDHAGSLNAIRVYRGELASRVFVPAAGRPGGWTGVSRGGIHQLANTVDEDLVTVHIYAPPLLELTVYSTDSADVERRPLRYTLADDLA